MTQGSGHNSSPAVQAPLVLSAPDLDEALDFFTQHLGFRLDMIVPAEAPQTAVVSGQGLTLRLESRRPPPLAGPPGAAPAAPEFLVSRLDTDSVWHAGRAGLQYRDLIPGRLDGRCIASHLRFQAGGAVPDYVHYHKLGFQMIYCQAGWVRVVYEDQGPPFVLAAGDCVLQPPRIRHRVLEASPGLAVLELACPARHETWADHELELPTARVWPERRFHGQSFVRHQASQAVWQPWRCAGFRMRDTGIAAATGGLAGARVVQAAAAVTVQVPASGPLFLFVLQGELALAAQAGVAGPLRAGDSCVIPAGLSHTLRAGAGLEFLEVSLPA